MCRAERKKIVFCLGTLIFVLVGGALVGRFFFVHSSRSQEKIITVAGKKIKAELAITSQEHARGLSGREAICEDCGMLFVFDKKSAHIFWMKDMRFDLDMLWISDKTIVQIDKNVPYGGGMKELRSPKMAVDKVLEVRAGESERLGIKEGDEVKF